MSGDMLTTLLNESQDEPICDHKAAREKYDFDRWMQRAKTCPVVRVTDYCPLSKEYCPTKYSELDNCPFWHWMAS